MGNLENLIGRKCMVKAVASALNKPPPLLALETRSRQLEIGDQQLDPFEEAINLQIIFQTFGVSKEVKVQFIRSLQELESLVKNNQNVFVGLAKGQEGRRPHIVHLEKRIINGFISKQQFTSDELLLMQLDEQHQLVVFLAS